MLVSRLRLEPLSRGKLARVGRVTLVIDVECFLRRARLMDCCFPTTTPYCHPQVTRHSPLAVDGPVVPRWPRKTRHRTRRPCRWAPLEQQRVRPRNLAATLARTKARTGRVDAGGRRRKVGQEGGGRVCRGRHAASWSPATTARSCCFRVAKLNSCRHASAKIDAPSRRESLRCFAFESDPTPAVPAHIFAPSITPVHHCAFMSTPSMAVMMLLCDRLQPPRPWT